MLPVLPVLLAATTVLATGCGDDDATPRGDRAGAPNADRGDGADGPDEGAPQVPEECRTAFPLAYAEPDLADVALLPGGFPDPPVPATLCLTSETVGGGTETASYATEASPEEVLAGYEEALASFGAAREEDGIGRAIVTATAGDVAVQVTPQDGGFVLAFARG